MLKLIYQNLGGYRTCVSQCILVGALAFICIGVGSIVRALNRKELVWYRSDRIRVVVRRYGDSNK